MLFILFGFIAGLLTTLSGYGGGVLLVICLATVVDPIISLTISSLALFVGNLHRAFLFRRSIRIQALRPFIFAAMAGATGGALLTVSIPILVVQMAIMVMIALALWRAFTNWVWHPSTSHMVSSGTAMGMVAATTGSAGLLIGPFLLATGLNGNRYIGTAAVVAISIHLARIFGYSLSGSVTEKIIESAILIAAALMVGNFMGKKIRMRMPLKWTRYLEFGLPVVCAILALWGLG